MNLDYVLDELLKERNMTREDYEKFIEEERRKTLLSTLEQENDQLRKRVESTEQALLFLMDMGMM